MDVRKIGKFVRWNPNGFGFILQSDGSQIFCHYSNLMFGEEGNKNVLPNTMVKYSVGERNGRKTAINVTLVSAPESLVRDDKN